MINSVKRSFDIIGSLSGIIFLSPLMALLAIIVRVTLGTPVIYRQIRPGLHGKPFVLHKFRTMPDLKGNDGEMAPDENRLTPVGRLLRGTSLDELPELFNVLKGDMSLVGPRPLLTEYLPLYSPEQARRHDVRPGMTGWAQVNGRNTVGWEDKFMMDLWYIDNRSLPLDLKIILMTLSKVFRREGISQEGEATMSRFKGSAKT